MAKDFINILQEIRGHQELGQTALPTEDDGIYHDLLRKTLEDDGITTRMGPGLYGSMKAMYEGMQLDMGTLSALTEVLGQDADFAALLDAVANKASVEFVEQEILAVNTIAPYTMSAGGLSPTQDIQSAFEMQETKTIYGGSF